MQIRTVLTSILAIALAVGVSFPIMLVAIGLQSSYGIEHMMSAAWSFKEIAASLVPSSIVEPFVTVSPFPMVVVVLLATYALCTTVKYFNEVKKAIDVCYALFSRMLHVVMATLPFFCFITFAVILLASGPDWLLEMLVLFLVAIVSIVVLAASYAIRLRVRGIRVIPFAKKLVPLLVENFKIGSAIEAVPFNVRYCAKHFGMDRSRAKKNLQVTAQTNLDGNCYLIMLVTLVFLFVTNSDITWANIASMAVLVLFLSLGAPNQPGSILIGVLIVLTYLNAFNLFAVAILAEVLLGGIQNIVNVTGDIVLAAIEDRMHS